eukprot:CAMPEP_0194340938 /NCGR_PEP_ID=MMETSP0171-20130528/88051_1 /TAXON_ID=218684 /ORGANISM="Corethron pennatum, Strain L29A3" /LENGTH=96 /DNA_ID=CAMNT_0039106083 /DNA_START=9 /DNA_END=296 /DNA_ORIENTATION=-
MAAVDATGAADAPDYESEASAFGTFLSTYVTPDSLTPYYPPLLQRIKDRSQVLLQVRLSHLLDWDDPRGPSLAGSARDNAKRYQADVFCRAVDAAL